jgi:hypothetical protein
LSIRYWIFPFVVPPPSSIFPRPSSLVHLPSSVVCLRSSVCSTFSASAGTQSSLFLDISVHADYYGFAVNYYCCLLVAV